MKQEIFKYDGTQNYEGLIKDNIYYVDEVLVFDLTATFGKGNEPLTIGEMRSRIPYLNQPQYIPIKPNITNREWLLSWDDEFLARALVNYRFCTYCIYSSGDCDVDKCYDGITKWLQAEHKE